MDRVALGDSVAILGTLDIGVEKGRVAKPAVKQGEKGRPFYPTRGRT
jgi:hypothetical protein